MSDDFRVFFEEFAEVEHRETVVIRGDDARAFFGDVLGDEYGLWMLSFCDSEIAAAIPEGEQRPGGPSYLGGCVVEGDGMEDAVRRAWEVGCNPGGEVKGFGPFGLDDIGPEWRDRLLTQAEVEAIPPPARFRP